VASVAPLRPEDRLARGGPLIELLRPFAWCFGLIVRARNAAYDRGLLPSARVDAPVICVGNITTGGTGKTPVVEALTRALVGRGLRPGVLSRGYRAPAAERGPATKDGARRPAGDEARMLARSLPGVPLVQDPDRIRGARELVRLGCDAIVLDDGFQHRRLERDADLVLIDATRPFGLPWVEGHAPEFMLPRGLLREPPTGLRRARACILTRTDQIEPEHLAALEARIHALVPELPVLHAIHRPLCLRDSGGQRFELERLIGTTVDLVSGIGNAGAFETTVAGLGARIVEHRRFGDHHDYTPKDVIGLGRGGRVVVTTAKDAVKLETLLPAAFALEIGVEFVRGAPILEALLDGLEPSLARRRRDSLHEGLHG
jgi:tetraacyldisaccharide 4'-kinase